ncbi:ABC transporter permease [Candidatus Dependentiae bacterium]|nr:ABC transporter permease [Candidatus Dependentiae bacterium]
MKKIITIIIKEFKQIFRDKGMLPLIFIMPVIQLVILSNAATYEVKNIKFYAVDYDKSGVSRDLITQFTRSSYFELAGHSTDLNEAENQLHLNNIDLIIVIRNDFEKNLTVSGIDNVQFIINAIDGSTAGIINSYAYSILSDFNDKYNDRLVPSSKNRKYETRNSAKINYTNWYNETLNYKTYMVPGILVILVTIIAMFLSAMSLAKEKEIGTIEQLNVSPILKHEMIIGKLIPVMTIGFIELSIGLIISKIAFGIPFRGSITDLYILTFIYLISILSLGILISIIAETQQQAMFLSWFFMVVFILLSGIFTSIESMPVWAQQITKFIPLSYYISSVRNILLKGSSIYELRYNYYVLLIFAVIFSLAAILKFKKVSN